MRLAGWRLRGSLPQEPRFVAILAPHTSNWDFLLGIAAMFALGFRLTWLGKHTIFRGPAGPLLRWLGGEPVDRTVAGGIVSTAIERFAARRQYALGLSPEGTRQRVSEWKTGFHRIARGAGTPIVPVVLDYQQRTMTIGAPFWPGDDVDGDLASLRALFRKEMAKHPEQFAEPADTSDA
jgi:1-acyl-sn-glycerol-3-phosphate acyltransferase